MLLAIRRKKKEVAMESEQHLHRADHLQEAEITVKENTSKSLSAV